MKNCHFVVTGAARGIGFALSKRLIASGAKVTMVDIDEEPLLAATQAFQRDSYRAIVLDVTEEGRVHDTFRALGPIDGLVNNASILDASSFEDMAISRYRQVMQVNLESAVHCCRAAIPSLKSSKQASIVNVASIMGLYGTPNSVPYSTAKAGLINLTRCLAVDLGGLGITVNAVAPGFIKTRMSKLPDGSSEYATDDFRDVYEKHKRLPAQRVGLPEDIAGPIKFLLSQDARYVTGQVLTVDGGVTATY